MVFELSFAETGHPILKQHMTLNTAKEDDFNIHDYSEDK